LTGGYAGGQAEYARVPFADLVCSRFLMTNRRSSFVSQIFSLDTWRRKTAILSQDTVAIWGVWLDSLGLKAYMLVQSEYCN